MTGLLFKLSLPFAILPNDVPSYRIRQFDAVEMFPNQHKPGIANRTAWL